jgi:hypothetical protein
MKLVIRQYVHDEQGATAIEYALNRGFRLDCLPSRRRGDRHGLEWHIRYRIKCAQIDPPEATGLFLSRC